MTTSEQNLSLASSAETGKLNVMHLKRYWHKQMAKKNNGLPNDAYAEEWKTDVTLLSTLGLGIEQTIVYLYQQSPAFHEFEEWIIEINGGIVPEEKINLFNAQVSGVEIPYSAPAHDVLSECDLASWTDNGYIILRGAVPKADCEATIAMICAFLEIDINDPDTWYRPHPARQGIMVQLFQHPLLQKNRESNIIRMAYEQLWGRKDIWLNTDRVGFNPPETATYHFPGPNLHWDVSLDLPIPFGLQGILYLSDTQANQGAFTLVPGFQHRIDGWINSLPAGANPRREDLYALGATPIAANAGDFIIWHHALPHGSSPNTSERPRIVQYINYEPINQEVKKKWI